MGRPRARARHAAPRRARARLRGGAVGHRRARRRRVDRDLPDRPEPPRRGDPRRIRRAGPGRRGRRRARRRHRRDAGRGDGPDRHADRGAVPPARRLARRQRARAARPQQRPLDDRGRRHVPVRAAHPGDLRARPRRDRGDQPDRDGQPARHRSATRRRASWAPRSPWPIRPSTCTCTTSARLRTPQDGPPDGARRDVGRRRSTRRDARGALTGRTTTTEDDR